MKLLAIIINEKRAKRCLYGNKYKDIIQNFKMRKIKKV